MEKINQLECRTSEEKLLNFNAKFGKGQILFHSTNDYLSFPDGQDVLNQMPVETYTYPYGDHLGVLNDETMIKDLKMVLTKLKTIH